MRCGGCVRVPAREGESHPPLPPLHYCVCPGAMWKDCVAVVDGAGASTRQFYDGEMTYTKKVFFLLLSCHFLLAFLAVGG